MTKPTRTFLIILGIVVVVVIVILILLCDCCSGPPAKKYALLASTRTANAETVSGNGDFWFDLVLTYRTLLAHEFEKQDIFVLYGDGNDFQTTFAQYSSDPGVSSLGKITDIPLKNAIDGDKANLCNVLCCLSTGRPAQIAQKVCSCLPSGDLGVADFKCEDYSLPHLREEDFLFLWIRGHGNSTACKTELTFDDGPYITDDEISGLIANLRPDRRVLVFETCDAMGWLNDLKGKETAVLVSSGGPGSDIQCKEKSNITPYAELSTSDGATNLIPHGRFSYWLNTAVRQKDLLGFPFDADADDNSLVSINEGFVAANQEITKEDVAADPKYGGKMHPAIFTESDVAPCVYLGLPVPGAEREVFSRDNLTGVAGMQADLFAVANSESPDLWVNQNPGCSQQHQKARSRQDNYLCARIWNIGCADPGPVEVRFFLTESCDSPIENNEIGAAEIQSLPLGTSAVVDATWAKDDVPSSGGDYCLIARLSASGDRPQRRARPESDDNRVQITVQVIEPSSLPGS